MIIVPPLWMYLSLFFIASMAVAIYLIVKSSSQHPVEEIEAEADTYAGTIRDSYGPVTPFLWLTYIVLAGWLIAYIIQHLATFYNLYY